MDNEMSDHIHMSPTAPNVLASCAVMLETGELKFRPRPVQHDDGCLACRVKPEVSRCSRCEVEEPPGQQHAVGGARYCSVCVTKVEDPSKQLTLADYQHDSARYMRALVPLPPMTPTQLADNALKKAAEILCPLCARGMAVEFGFVREIGDNSWMHPTDGSYIFKETECPAAKLHEVLQKTNADYQGGSKMSAMAVDTQLARIFAQKQVGMNLLADVCARYPIVADILHAENTSSIVEIVGGRGHLEKDGCLIAVEPVTGDQHGVTTGHALVRQTDSGRCLIVLGSVNVGTPWRVGDRLLTREQLKEAFGQAGHIIEWC